MTLRGTSASPPPSGRVPAAEAECPGGKETNLGVKAAPPLSLQLGDLHEDARQRARRADSGHRVAAIEPPSSTRTRRIPPVFRTARPRFIYITEARRFGPSTRNVL